MRVLFIALIAPGIFIGAQMAQAQLDQTEPKALVRVPAMAPMKALELGISGACAIEFDLSDLGKPYNVEAVQCTDQMFKRSAERAVSKFRYAPGNARTQMKLTVKYKLLDDDGNETPMPELVDKNIVPDVIAELTDFGKTIREPSAKSRNDNSYCCMTHAVSNLGQAFNMTYNCTGEALEEYAYTAIKSNVYAPATFDGRAVSSAGYETMLWFRKGGKKVYWTTPEDRQEFCGFGKTEDAP